MAVNTPPEVIIDGDALRLRSVVDELLSNALAWTSDRGEVGITVHSDEHTAVLAVTNAGIRIPAEERERVFDLFFRPASAVLPAVRGQGLGLTLARAVVEQHGGTISVSEPDEAVTTFTIRLPTSQHPVCAAGE